MRVGKDRQTERSAGVDRGPVNRQRGPEHLGEAVRGGRHGGCVGAVDNDPEFVAADARDQIAMPGNVGQAIGDGDQQRVAMAVAIGVVDELEAVEIDEQQADRAPVLDRSREGALDLFGIMKAVGDRGQMVGRADLERRLARIVDLSGARLDTLLEIGVELAQPLVGGEQFQALALQQPLGLMARGMLALGPALQAPRPVLGIPAVLGRRGSPRIKRGV